MANAQRLPLHDLYQVSWLDFNGVDVLLTKPGDRVLFEVEASEDTYRLLKEYEANPQVGLLDIVRSLRRMRARMLDLRDGNGERERRIRNGREGQAC